MTSTQYVILATNVDSASITLVQRISPSSLLMHGEKLEKFNGLNF